MSAITYLLSVGSSPNVYKVPLKVIARGTYKAVAEKIIAGQYSDGDGVDHYDVLTNRKLNVELTISACPAAVYDDLIGNIRAAFINANEENVLLTAYVPKLGAYVSQEAMFVDETPAVNAIVDGALVYEKVKLKFNGKGGPIS